MESTEIHPLGRWVHYVYRIGVACAILGIGAILLLTYWLSFPYKVLVIHNQPTPVDVEVAQKGDRINTKVDYCKQNDTSGRVEKYLVTDGIEYRLPIEFDLTPRACGVVDMPISLPTSSTIVPGVYHVRVDVIYKVNPVRTITEEFTTEKFSIIN